MKKLNDINIFIKNLRYPKLFILIIIIYDLSDHNLSIFLKKYIKYYQNQYITKKLYYNKKETTEIILEYNKYIINNK